MGLEVKKRRVPLKRRSAGHRQYANEQRFRSFRAAVISAFVLLFLVAGAGVAYAWYIGQQPNDIPETPLVTEEESEPQVVEAPKPVKVQPVGVAVQLITSPIEPGDDASISIHTNPMAKCTIEVEYDKIPYSDKNLVPKEADEFGIVTWEWNVAKTTPLGTWPVTVKCKNSRYWGVAVGDLEVAYPKKTES